MSEQKTVKTHIYCLVSTCGHVHCSAVVDDSGPQTDPNGYDWLWDCFPESILSANIYGVWVEVDIPLPSTPTVQGTVTGPDTRTALLQLIEKQKSGLLAEIDKHRVAMLRRIAERPELLDEIAERLENDEVVE